MTTKYIAGCIVKTVHVLKKPTVKTGMGNLDHIVRDLRLQFGVLKHSYVRHNCLNLMGYWLFETQSYPEHCIQKQDASHSCFCFYGTY